jgi:Domain of unknown function (DUF4332)
VDVNDHELTRVVGIGAARARWFEEAFGVRTLSELAALDAADIAERLRARQARGVVPTHEQIDQWIAQAGQLAASWRGVGSFVLEIEARDDNGNGSRRLRTVAHHVEDDCTQNFDGAAPAELTEWIVGRLAAQPAAPAPPSSSAPPAGPALAPVGELHLVASVRDPSGQAPTNVIRHGDPWMVRCVWYVDGPGAGSLAGRWRVELLGEGQGPAIEVELPAPALITLDGRTGPANPYVLAFNVPAGSIALLGRPQAVLDLTVALTYLDPAGTPGPLAAFAVLEKVMVFRAD